MPARFALFALLLPLAVLGFRDGPTAPTASQASPASQALPAGLRRAAPPAAVDVPGLHNVIRLTPDLYTGSGPEGDLSFRSLQQLGVRTVLSVDGARPDAARARRFGLRYVHLPVGYDGVPREQGLRIAKAIRELPGPVYLHCHHGRHRGPAAAAYARRCLDERCGAGEALAYLGRAGTDPRYVGLYGAVRDVSPVSPAEWAGVPADFPEAAEVGAVAQTMVQIDGHWEHLKAVRAAGWRTPPGHPDLDPPHEALLVREGYRESLRTPAGPDEMRRWLAEAEEAAGELEAALRRGATAEAEAAFKRSAALCARCHAKYRDVPRR